MKIASKKTPIIVRLLLSSYAKSSSENSVISELRKCFISAKLGSLSKEMEPKITEVRKHAIESRKIM